MPAATSHSQTPWQSARIDVPVRLQPFTRTAQKISTCHWWQGFPCRCMCDPTTNLQQHPLRVPRLSNQLCTTNRTQPPTLTSNVWPHGTTLQYSTGHTLIWTGRCRQNNQRSGSQPTHRGNDHSVAMPTHRNMQITH